MSLTPSRITPCLWFDSEAEEAATFYTGVIPGSRMLEVVRHTEAGPGAPGSVLTVSFELDGVRFVALNGGPVFSFGEAVSFQIACETQEEVDRYWQALADGGEEGPCGWLKDRFGLSWQVVPTVLPRLLGSPDPAVAGRVMTAMRDMGKLDIAALQAAADGAAR
jgi:predicted 3-demethylubiquinone-9 3-methyltransferase (glyoxalase superfamily)